MRNVKRFPFTSLSWHSICIIVFCAQAFALVPHETELAMNRSVIWLCWIRLSFEYLDLIHSRAQITKLFSIVLRSYFLLRNWSQLVFTPFKWKSLMRKSWCCKQLSESQILLPLFSKSIKVKLVKKIEALNWNRFPCNAYVLMVVIALLVSVACFSLLTNAKNCFRYDTFAILCGFIDCFAVNWTWTAWLRRSVRIVLVAFDALANLSRKLLCKFPFIVDVLKFSRRSINSHWALTGWSEIFRYKLKYLGHNS